MASYNGERFIENQITSILCQLREDDELIVVDDKSVDGTVQILKNFNDDRIKISCNAENMGSNASFQKALSLASGRYIFLSDQDDVWYKNKVQILPSTLDGDDAAILGASALVWKENI